MTRLALLFLLCAGCAGPAVYIPAGLDSGGGERAKLRLREPNTPSLIGEQVEAALAPAAVTITWTMPRLKANGDTLSTAPLDWQAAYSTQSRTWVAHRWPIITDPDSAAYYWPAVVSEAAPLVVMSGTAVPGAHVSVTPVPVTAGDWPFSWWIRTRQRPNGEWSLWSNPCSRADNQ